jgi:hypothetical protein
MKIKKRVTNKKSNERQICDYFSFSFALIDSQPKDKSMNG